MRWTTRTGPRASGVLLAVLLLGGCGASAAREDGATEAGRRFAAALAAGDYRAGCALLAPETREQVEEDGRTPCALGLREAGLPPAGLARGVDVYGREALLRMTADTLFLSQFDAGWLVTAAGCEEQATEDEPYRCAVKGG
ncbi:hypothetical protein [Streptomyces sp. NRRL F-5727]|uniref:hypothetical protein n=1 Tax=Streptomyces sp. NRRL F-5727 TaxID=1463871 RepID=UPI0004C56378|nr:hypothetical protein [Streptomyces sp. NRRL F-5727]